MKDQVILFLCIDDGYFFGIGFDISLVTYLPSAFSVKWGFIKNQMIIICSFFCYPAVFYNHATGNSRIITNIFGGFRGYEFDPLFSRYNRIVF